MKYGGAGLALLSSVVFTFAPPDGPVTTASMIGVVAGIIVWFIYRSDT